MKTSCAMHTIFAKKTNKKTTKKPQKLFGRLWCVGGENEVLGEYYKSAHADRIFCRINTM